MTRELFHLAFNSLGNLLFDWGDKRIQSVVLTKDKDNHTSDLRWRCRIVCDPLPSKDPGELPKVKQIQEFGTTASQALWGCVRKLTKELENE